MPSNTSQSEEEQGTIAAHSSLLTAENEELCQEAACAQNTAMSLLQANNEKLQAERCSCAPHLLFFQDKMEFTLWLLVSWTNYQAVSSIRICLMCPHST